MEHGLIRQMRWHRCYGRIVEVEAFWRYREYRRKRAMMLLMFRVMRSIVAML